MEGMAAIPRLPSSPYSSISQSLTHFFFFFLVCSQDAPGRDGPALPTKRGMHGTSKASASLGRASDPQGGIHGLLRLDGQDLRSERRPDRRDPQRLPVQGHPAAAAQDDGSAPSSEPPCGSCPCPRRHRAPDLQGEDPDPAGRR